MNIKNNVNYNKIIFSLKESFLAMTPYFIVSSAVTLLFQLANNYFFPGQFSNIEFASELLQVFYPLLLLISVSYYLAETYKIDHFMAVLLALSILMTISSYALVNQGHLIQMSQKVSIYALFIPIFSTLLIAKFNKPQEIDYLPLGSSLSRFKQNFLLFIGLYLVSATVLLVVDALMAQLMPKFLEFIHSLSLPITLMAVIREVIVYFLCFFGLHGSNLFDLLVDKQQYQAQFIVNNLTATSFNDLFTSIGGTNCLALAIAVLLQNKNKQAQTTAKMAMPFLVFNISELMMFGLPVVLNRYLLVPFLFIPVMNFAIAYLFLTNGYIEIVPHHIPWTTPTLLSGYLATGGHFSAVLLQGLLIFLGILVYSPFVNRYLASESVPNHQHTLQNKLYLRNRIKARESQQFQKAQSFIVNSHIATHKIIELFVKHELCLFYQPKVSSLDFSCRHFEALLRLRMTKGEIVKPYFLETLEQAGFAPIIDLWVSQQVKNDFQRWKAVGFKPSISVNLHPETLADDVILQEIIQTLQGLSVEFEILEKAVVEGEKIKANIDLLHRNGFTLAIDDFGSGYSSLDTLVDLKVETIKLDKCLVDNILTVRGMLLYKHVAGMCKELGYVLIAEGVETEGQYLAALESGVDFMQGFYFSQALPFDEVKPFSEIKLVFNK